MPYCSRCGVEVDDNIKFCPLCNSKIQHFNKTPVIPENFPTDSMIPSDYQLPFEKKKKIIWSIFSFLLAITLFIIFAVNFLLNRTITWGWIPIFSILLCWGITAIIYYLYKKIYFFILSVFILIMTYLFFILLLFHNLNIFFLLALPILISIFINIFFFIIILKNIKKKGYNIIGFLLIATTLLCICIDAIITFFITSKFLITWSIVAIALSFPLTIFFFYIHYILKWTPDIKKIFHI